MSQRLTLQKMSEERNTSGNSLLSSLNGFDLLGILWSRRALLGIVSLTVSLVTATVLFLTPNKYASNAVILPTVSGDKFADLKALAGIKGGGASSENSSELFPTILYSQTIEDALIARRFLTGKNPGDSITLAEYFGEDNPDKLREAITEVTGVSSDRKTGIISLTVVTELPGLSQSLAQGYLDELEKYNMYKRRSQGKLNVDYLERQLKVQNTELAKAEDGLELFQSENRDWSATSNPEIVKGLARLQREVEIRSSAVMFLNQQYEMAKFDAQKDIPIVQVLDYPAVPTAKAGPKRMVWVVLSFFVTAFILGTLILLATILRRMEKGEKAVEVQSDTLVLPTPISRMARILAQKELIQS